jgi:hypothetical protein
LRPRTLHPVAEDVCGTSSEACVGVTMLPDRAAVQVKYKVSEKLKKKLENFA